MLVDLVVSRPLPRWQMECINQMEKIDNVRLRERAISSPPAGLLWRLIAGRCRMLALSNTALPAATAEGGEDNRADLVIDLAGAGAGATRPGQSYWTLVQGDGRPLSAAFPFADRWSRPDVIGSVSLVDECNRVLRTAHLSTNGKFYPRMLDEILRVSAYLPAQGIRDWQRGHGPAGTPVVTPPSMEPAPSPVPEGSAKLPATEFALAGLRYARRRLHDMPRVSLWQVGLASQPIHRFLDPTAEPSVEWLTRLEDSAYCADPFAQPDDSGDIWWERYDYGSGRGVLQRARPQESSTAQPVDLGIDVHLSYPFLTCIANQIILIPEMSASGTTCIYRLGPAGQPELVASLPVPGIDPILYRWADRYWLGLTRADIDARSNYCLWHAADLTGPWTPHADNPVKIDVRSARSAGTPFWHENLLYRPAQDCSSDYGQAVTINRVLECTPSRYREEVATVVRPKPHWPGSQGMHTLSVCGNRTLFDTKVTVFSMMGLWSKTRCFLRERNLARHPPFLKPSRRPGKLACDDIH